MATGLSPAAELYRLAGTIGDGTNRDDFRTLALGHGRIAVLRPQSMADRTLIGTPARSFAGRPDAWRRHIKAHVLFWSDPRRRDGFACACRRLRSTNSGPHVLAIDTVGAAVPPRRAHSPRASTPAQYSVAAPVRGATTRPLCRLRTTGQDSWRNWPSTVR